MKWQQSCCMQTWLTLQLCVPQCKSFLTFWLNIIYKMKYSFQEFPIGHKTQPNRFQLPVQQIKSQPPKILIRPQRPPKQKKRLQFPKKLVKIKNQKERKPLSKWDYLQDHIRLVYSKCKKGQIHQADQFKKFVSQLKTQGFFEMRMQSEQGHYVQYIELKVLQANFLGHFINDFLQNRQEQDFFIQKFRALRNVLASTLQTSPAKSSEDLIDQIIDEEYFSDLGKLSKLSNQRIKDLGECDFEQDFKEELQDISSAGKLDWIIEVDSIFNYRQRVNKLRPHFFSSNQYQVRSSCDTHFKYSRESKIKAVPPYFCAREVNQNHKKLWNRLQQWQSEMRNTLRIYHLQIQNAKRNIQKKINGQLDT